MGPVLKIKDIDDETEVGLEPWNKMEEKIKHEVVDLILEEDYEEEKEEEASNSEPTIQKMPLPKYF